MKKKVFLVIVAIMVACGLWGWYVTTTSNTWDAKTIGDIPAPRGYTRVEAEDGSYAAYLRSLPLKKRGAKVQLYTGGEANYQILSTGVIDMTLLSNSEQCADVTMRLRAEYLWKKGRYGEICFRNVNGKNMRYTGGSSRKAFEKYMREVFGVCSTFSEYRETTPRSIKDVQPGDVLVYPARPGHRYGHAVIVTDVARNGSGKIAIMCAEGNTPARDMHVVRNLNPFQNPWFFINENDKTIKLSYYHFRKSELRHY